MSIQTIQAYRVGDTTYDDLAKAKAAALLAVIGGDTTSIRMVESIVEHGAEVISILEWGGESAPAKKTRKTRKDKGTKRSEVKPAVVEGSGKYEGK